MKRIGIIGGMSWESTANYYSIMNEEVKRKLGGLHSAKILLESIDFAIIENMMRCGDWAGIGYELAASAGRLQAGGADFIVIATNAMHKVCNTIEAEVDAPVLHIVDPTAEEIIQRGFNKIGLLGTTVTMEDDFYRGRLINKFGIEAIIPDRAERIEVNRVIFDELCLGHIEKDSRDKFIEITEKLAQQGADGIILGCTEIAMLLSQDDVALPLFDTTELHAKAAVAHSLKTN